MKQVSSLVILAFLVAGCRRGMVDQQKVKPLAENTFFADGRGSRMPPAHTVARGELRDDEQLYTGKIGKELAGTFPMPVTRDLLRRGEERFNIDCAVCHGASGAGDGMIVRRGFPQPPSFHDDRLRNAPVGHFVDVNTNGYGVMYPYASRVRTEARWAIAAYIRALQLSQHAAPGDVDPAHARELEASR